MAVHTAIMAQAREEYRSRILTFRQQEEKKQAELKKAHPRLQETTEKLRELSLAMVRTAMAGRTDRIEEIRKQVEAVHDTEAEILRDAGEDTRLFRTRYYCNKCRDEGYTDRGPCECLMRIYKELLLDHYSSYLGKASFGEFDFDLFSEIENPYFGVAPRANIEFNYDQCLEYARGFKPGKGGGLFIHGACGVGKSFLAASVAREVIEKGYFAHYVSAIDLFSLFERNRFGRADEHDEDDLKAVKECDLLVIDDLASEYQSAQNTPVLSRLMEERIHEKKAFVIVSSYTGDELARRYSAQVESRISGVLTNIFVIGEDLRKIDEKLK